MTFSLEEIKGILGLDPHIHSRWERFRTCVLDACQKALTEYTDIKFTYEPIRKGIGKGVGRKITHVKFAIKKNKGHADQLSLEDFIELQPEIEIIDKLPEEADPLEQYEEHLQSIAEACNFEFPNPSMQVIFNMLLPITDELVRYRLVKRSYDRFKMYAYTNSIASPFGYFEKVISTELAKLKI